MQRVIGAVWLGLVVQLSGTAVCAEEYRPGDKVVVIEDANLTVSGNKVVDEVWPGLVLTVRDVNGEWLWLSHGKPGYLSRDKVIPLNRAAIDRLTEMLKANPRSARLYSGRANVWKNLGELDIAMGDYNEAIRLDPSAAAYNNRGVVWYDKQEYDKALRDFNESLRLDPKYTKAYNNRGNVWNDKHEYDKAIADYNEAQRLDPKDFSSTFNRGAVSVILRKRNAIADFQRVLEIESGRGEYSAYSVILGHLTARLLGEEQRASEFLEDHWRQLPAAWPTPTVRFLRGEIGEAAYLAQADTNDKLTDAHCYIGLKALADQRSGPARTHFEWVRDHGNKTFIEYRIAIAELKRLDQK